MKLKLLLVLSILFMFSKRHYAQTNTDTTNGGEIKANVFSVIVGLGVGGIMNSVYLTPVINKTNNSVIIENGDRMRFTATIGLAWSPKVTFFTEMLPGKYQKFLTKDDDFGPIVALFANPASLSNVKNNTSFDWGTGVGLRYNGLAALITVDFFSLRQPRTYFINQYKDKNLPFVIDGNFQSDIATTDNSIFRDKSIAAFGFKIVVPIEIFKSVIDTKD